MSGLIPLGDPDAVACEGDVCDVPPAPPQETSLLSHLGKAQVR